RLWDAETGEPFRHQTRELSALGFEPAYWNSAVGCPSERITSHIVHRRRPGISELHGRSLPERPRPYRPRPSLVLRKSRPRWYRPNSLIDRPRSCFAEGALHTSRRDSNTWDGIRLRSRNCGSQEKLAVTGQRVFRHRSPWLVSVSSEQDGP